MADNVLIATKNDVNGAHQQVVQEFLDGGGSPVAVSVANPLPVEATLSISGVATAANQIDGSQLTQIVDAGGESVTVTGGKLDVNASFDTTGLATSDLQETGNSSLASIDSKTPALGQALAAASVPIVLTAAQLLTLTPPAAITGFLTEADFDTKTGSLTETAPATDTASSGLNGRLQRIAQRITSLITALGNPFQAGGSIGNTSFGATQSGTWTVQPGNTANTTAWKVDASSAAVPVTDNGSSLTVDAPLATPVFTTLTPNTTGGWSTFMATSADGSTALTNSAQAIKGSAGTFGGYYIFNPNSVQIYVSIYNVVAASVTVGTTNPQNSFCIPPLAAANIEITNGINFSTAISCAATTLGGNNVAPSIALEANFWYK